MSQGLHQDEKRQFERLLRQQRMNRLGDRLAVVDVFLNSEEHLTVDGWCKLLKKRGLNLEPSFVGQTLELLTRFGLATRRDFDGAPTLYEHQHLGEHHDHLICTCCGSITEFNDPRLEALQDEVAKERGFHCLRHRHQIYGLCNKCLQKRECAMSLAMASPGERLRVETIAGGDRAVKQLNDLGLTMGTELEVISSEGGPVVIAVGGTRLALGRGLADKVRVAPSIS